LQSISYYVAGQETELLVMKMTDKNQLNNTKWQRRLNGDFASRSSLG